MEELINDWKKKLEDLEADREVLYKELHRLGKADWKKEKLILEKMRTIDDMLEGLWQINTAIKDFTFLYSYK